MIDEFHEDICELIAKGMFNLIGHGSCMTNDRSYHVLPDWTRHVLPDWTRVTYDK